MGWHDRLRPTLTNLAYATAAYAIAVNVPVLVIFLSQYFLVSAVLLDTIAVLATK